MEADLSSAEFYEWLDDFDSTEIKNERKIVIVSPPSASNVSYYNCWFLLLFYCLLSYSSSQE